jgi:hypothetical protein
MTTSTHNKHEARQGRTRVIITSFPYIPLTTRPSSAQPAVQRHLRRENAAPSHHRSTPKRHACPRASRASAEGFASFYFSPGARLSRGLLDGVPWHRGALAHDGHLLPDARVRPVTLVPARPHDHGRRVWASYFFCTWQAPSSGTLVTVLLIRMSLGRRLPIR